MQETKTETVGFRLSPQQQQLLAPGGIPGVTQCAVLLDGPVDVGKLQDALNGALARHEILRTTFVQPTGMRAPQQVIGAESAPESSIELEQSAAALIDDGRALEQLMSREAERQFDLERGPLLRALLVGSGEQSALLLLTACSACADVTSLLLLLGQLCESYRGAGTSQEPVQYADYAEWRHELMDGEESEGRDGLAFWREDAIDRPLPPRILFALETGAGGRSACDCSARPSRGEARRFTACGRRRRRHRRCLPRGCLALPAGTHVRGIRGSGRGVVRRSSAAGPRGGDRRLRATHSDPVPLPGGNNVRRDPRPGAARTRARRALAGLRPRRGPRGRRRAGRRRMRDSGCGPAGRTRAQGPRAPDRSPRDTAYACAPRERDRSERRAGV